MTQMFIDKEDATGGYGGGGDHTGSVMTETSSLITAYLCSLSALLARVYKAVGRETYGYETNRKKGDRNTRTDSGFGLQTNNEKMQGRHSGSTHNNYEDFKRNQMDLRGLYSTFKAHPALMNRRMMVNGHNPPPLPVDWDEAAGELSVSKRTSIFAPFTPSCDSASL
ncbi:hypothetical protein MAR_017047 [Mya arenaria]|uniref:Uncharacterized protein n=1 Tax=Mya arenaria TaxID=6604 RepID=A0ABY7EDB0_MYAAR|nr:hypothetical protein MAR_017047 [Mya arenaria]